MANRPTPQIDDRTLLLFAGIAGALFGVGAVTLVQGRLASALPTLVLFVVSVLWVRQLRGQIAAANDASATG